MDTGEFLTLWPVRGAMALYVASLALRGFNPRWSRLAWTGGFLSYLVHIESAFTYYHHWSHWEAYASTARQTAETTGFDWGGGLFFNYAFTLIWLADVVWWWVDLNHYQARPRWIEWTVQGFLGFVAFNATVVFTHSWIRWAGIASCVVLALLFLGRWLLASSPVSDRSP